MSPERPSDGPAPRPARRRSRAIRLTLVGGAGGLAAIVGGCSQSDSFHRNLYRSEADCARDYSATMCETRGAKSQDGHLGPVFRMVGGRPRACTSSDPGPGPTWNTRRIDVQAVPRGGFGTSCPSRGRSWSSGGGRSLFSGGG